MPGDTISGKPMPTDVDALRADVRVNQEWYYAMELAPDVWTKGADFRSVALTRRLLARTGVEGARCLDIGAMEGLVSVLLHRRGAREVVAYDRAPRKGRIDIVKRWLDADFEYLHSLPMDRLAARLLERGDPFDLVVFSGVLYHMFDPMAGLAITRGLVRNGGIMIVETSATVDDLMGMHFNEAGRFFPRTNYWQPGLPCLDYLLRMFRLQPIDATHFLVPPKKGVPRLCRVAVACRAVDAPVALGEDAWMADDRPTDDNEFLDWSRVASDAPPVPYEPGDDALVHHDGTDVLDLLATVRAQPGDLPPIEQARLRHDDRA